MLVRWLITMLCLVSLPVVAQPSITVFAAASMTEALDKVAKQFEQQTQIKVKRSYASSSVLARQIAQGAPADVFISANVRWMDYLSELGAIEQDSVTPLVQNQLVVIMPNQLAVSVADLKADNTFETLLQGTRLAVGDPRHVPAGIYTQQALQSLGIWIHLKPRLARANSVRSALLWVERQEARVGVVYKTDALVSKRVEIIHQIPASSHDPIVYPIAKVTHSRSDATEQTERDAFFNYLTGEHAKGIFREFGFLVAQ
ncbi:molybdate ABC transporter substrate-binding protein [Vibrio sp. WXL103]|uniref:molybdate ABC transporter substrate-binding protein n=1 Tax=Vibrio sp. WXL103 TaxID=3450710 RepID=UPI003EC75F02